MKYPWREWLAAWLQLSRPLDEFWTLTPCQVLFVLEANGKLVRKQGSRSFLAALGSMGVPVEVPDAS